MIDDLFDNKMEKILKKRTKQVAIDVWHNCQKIDNKFYDFKRQLIRCSSSVGANYRAACRAKSDRDFLNKLKIVEEELDETMYFIELLCEIEPIQKKMWENTFKESNELTAIMVASIGTIREKLNQSK